MSPARTTEPTALLGQAQAGDRAALARLLSMVETGGSPSRAIAREAYRRPPPYTIGFTGAPGAGKSTLVDQLIAAARGGWPEPSEAIEQVAVVAVDPTSPFSGGAILGDRVRMQRHATDPSVFIRSMATRGHLGGLSLAVPDAVRLLGAAGMPFVVVETVGVGQIELDVASATDTVVLVVTPGWGDSMQTSKAGLLEAADLFVINKADRPGLREARRDLEQMLDLSAGGDWRPPIVETVASTGKGIEELWAAVGRHRAHLLASGELESRRRRRLDEELRRVVVARVLQQIESMASAEGYAEALRAVAEGRLDPYDAADRLLETHDH